MNHAFVSRVLKIPILRHALYMLRWGSGKIDTAAFEASTEVFLFWRELAAIANCLEVNVGLFIPYFRCRVILSDRLHREKSICYVDLQFWFHGGIRMKSSGRSRDDFVAESPSVS